MTNFIKLSVVKNDELKSVKGGLTYRYQITNDYGVEDTNPPIYVDYGVDSPL